MAEGTSERIERTHIRSSYGFIYARWLAASAGTGYFWAAAPRTFPPLSSNPYYTGIDRKRE